MDQARAGERLVKRAEELVAAPPPGRVPPVIPTVAERLDQLRRDAERIGALTDVLVPLPRAGRLYEIAQPDDTERLLDRAASDPEQNLPYWAEVWPSGIALADEISGHRGDLRRQRVLELGSGIGVTAISALEADAELTVADYAPESLILCRYNALRHTGREPATIQINWRQPDGALFERPADGFPVILAADVLYETRDVEPLLALVGRGVAPGGLLWLAEPGRPAASRFLQAAREEGWAGMTKTHSGPWPDPKDEGVVVRIHRLRRAG
jgi:predicted nicotinamide N-methyase